MMEDDIAGWDRVIGLSYMYRWSRKQSGDSSLDLRTNSVFAAQAGGREEGVVKGALVTLS